MSKVCMITGKRTATGNRVSHSNRKVKRTFEVNFQKKRFWLASQNRFIRLRLSSRAMRTIDKKGLENVLAELYAKGM